MTDSILNNCDPVTSMEEAKAPFISPLIPIKGLRHDANGELTDDAIQTIFDGMKSLGVDPKNEDTKTAIIEEAKKTICKINKQYEFLANSAGDEPVTDKDTLALMNERNQAMKDIASLSRRILDMSPKDTTMIEGFLGTSNNSTKLREAFDDISAKVEVQKGYLENGSVPPSEFRKRTYEVSEQENRFVNSYLSLYGFMNVVAAGLLFYIIAI